MHNKVRWRIDAMSAIAYIHHRNGPYIRAEKQTRRAGSLERFSPAQIIHPSSKEKDDMAKLQRSAHKRKGFWRNAPIVGVILAMNLAFECYGSGYVFLTVKGFIPYTTIPLAWAEVVMLTGCSLLSTLLMTRAALMAADPRPGQRKRAGTASAIALAAAAVPMGFCANGLAFQEQMQAHKAYIASPLFGEDKQTAADPMAEPSDEREARERLKQSVEPTKAELGPSHVFLALWLFGVALASARAGTLAEVETPAQAKAREARYRAAKAVETRKANAALKAAEAKALDKAMKRSVRKLGTPNVVEMLRKPA